MALTVDTIESVLKVRTADYIRDMKAAEAAYVSWENRVNGKGQAPVDTQVQRRSASVKKAVSAEIAAEQDGVRSKRAAKKSADAQLIRDEEATQARLTAVAERAAARRTAVIQRGSGARIGTSVPREGTSQRGIPSALLSGSAAEVAAEKEVNFLLRDQIQLESALGAASGKRRDALAAQLFELKQIQKYERAGVENAAELAAADLLRFRQSQKKGASGGRSGQPGELGQFALGATQGRFGYSFGPGAVAGFAGAAGIAVSAQVIASAVEYGKALANLSDQLGITVEDLQAYQKIARDTGVTQEQLTSAFGQFASNLGRAQQGGEDQIKTFRALGIDIKNFASAGDALPTVIDRISQIKDQAQRAAVETRLFGESGRRLDSLLSGGPERVAELAAALQQTGQALSAKEIQELDRTARKFEEVKNQLQVDFAQIVAGNADAIIGLANSFAQLSARVVDTIGKLQQFGATQISTGFLSGFASDDQKKFARQFQLSTPAGRAQLKQENNAKLDRLTGGNIALGTRLANDRSAGQSPRQVELRAALAERREILAAERSGGSPAATPSVQTGRVNTGALSRLGAPKPPKGKSAEQLAKAEEQRTEQYNAALASAQAEYLQALSALTGSAEERAGIEKKLAEAAYKQELKKIASDRKENVLSGANPETEKRRAATLALEAKRILNAQLAVIEQERGFSAQQALTNKALILLDVDDELLNQRGQLTKTAKERREVEERLLANAKSRERLELNNTIITSKPGSQELKDAQQRLGTLDQRYAGKSEAIRRNNFSPLEAFRDQIDLTADQIQEAFEQIEVNGIESLTDGITEAITGAKSLGDVFKNVANQIISDLVRIAVQQAIIKPLTGGGDGGGILGFLGGIIGGGGNPVGAAASTFSSIFKGVSGRAVGGPVNAGTFYKTSEYGTEGYASFSQPGRVIPLGEMRTKNSNGPTVVNQTVQVDARNSVNPEGFARQILTISAQQAQQAASIGSRAAIKAAPGAVASNRRFSG